MDNGEAAPGGNAFKRLALIAAPTERATEAAAQLRGTGEWVALDRADAVVVLGGDGTMLSAMHQMIDGNLDCPVYGLNVGTVGFLMNRYQRGAPLAERLAKARPIAVSPLCMVAVTQHGEEHGVYAVNEVSLLRQTRQTAKIEISVNGRVRIPELAADGVLLSTPVGSTAYNFSASGPILPLDSQMLALTPISPFRPRRWHGALVSNRNVVEFRVLDADKRPVSAVADQVEVRDVAHVRIRSDFSRRLELRFDPEYALDDRILMEQFLT
jgi:NAD+ kinase